ncbi:hypothetical protein DFH11DRAFT_1569059 [Phellopilus nigrolimitatus]|nr:hypothetical protein DFH11DRAFT_1569059 [Phellopilus nigrolimitatus]
MYERAPNTLSRPVLGKFALLFGYTWRTCVYPRAFFSRLTQASRFSGTQTLSDTDADGMKHSCRIISAVSKTPGDHRKSVWFCVIVLVLFLPLFLTHIFSVPVLAVRKLAFDTPLSEVYMRHATVKLSIYTITRPLEAYANVLSRGHARRSRTPSTHVSRAPGLLI